MKDNNYGLTASNLDSFKYVPSPDVVIKDNVGIKDKELSEEEIINFSSEIKMEEETLPSLKLPLELPLNLHSDTSLEELKTTTEKAVEFLKNAIPHFPKEEQEEFLIGVKENLEKFSIDLRVLHESLHDMYEKVALITERVELLEKDRYVEEENTKENTPNENGNV